MLRNLDHTMSFREGQPKIAKLQLLQGIISSGLRVFETTQVKSLAETLQIPAASVLTLIHRLVQDGWLIPIKRGVYQLSQTTGVSPIHEFEIVMHVVKPAMISYYSAFYHHGLTEQVPRVVYVTTVKESSTPQVGRLGRSVGFNFNEIDYQIVRLKKEKFFGWLQAWRGESAFLISDLERTLIEGFASPQYCGGFSEVIHGLEEALERISLERLIDYALCWDVAVARRVGWALAQLGIKNEQTLTLVQSQHPGFRLLDPSQPMQGSYSHPWKLRINI